MSEDRHFQALGLLQANPDLSQRALARALGVSVGSANFCARALVEKGWIKIQNVRTSKDKRAYAYLLTPQGIEPWRSSRTTPPGDCLHTPAIKPSTASPTIHRAAALAPSCATNWPPPVAWRSTWRTPLTGR